MKRNGPEACRTSSMRRLALLSFTLLALTACSVPAPPAQLPMGATPASLPPLPPLPWRDAGVPPTVSGNERWTDVSRDRTIAAQWTAPHGGGRALLVILPGLAQGSFGPPALIETLVDAGFAVLVIGHPGNDAGVWQSPEARRADFRLAARRMYSMPEVTDRADDVRFVLDSLARQPPAWLAADPKQRIGIIGIGLGAQTAQLLLGEKMARDAPVVSDARIAAAALIAPYVGFDGPAMHQRYVGITTPLLVAYGMTETDPNGLGMTGQQRRAMTDALTAARVIEVRLPAAALATMQAAIAATSPQTAPTLPPLPRSESGKRGERPQSGTGPSIQSAVPAARESVGGPPGPAAGSGRNEQLARVAVVFSVSAFFESELLRSADARDWLEGPHPGPVQWALLPAGRTAASR